jgi:hypothetical protein
MEALIYIGLIVVFFALAYWYIEVYTVRKHWREAIEETNAAMRWQKRGGPGQPTCDRCYGERDPRCCNFGRRLLGQVPPRPSPPAPPPMADTIYGCDEHYYGGCPNCGRGRRRLPP